MKNIIKNGISIVVLFSVTLGVALSQEQNPPLLKSIVDKTTISGQFFIGYQVIDKNDKYYNDFNIRRAAISLKTVFNDIVSVRYTHDITLDIEGLDAGELEMRLKYLFVRIENSFMPFMKNSWWEAGLTGTTLVTYEDKINDYRLHSAMFLDKYRVVPVSDFGISLSGLIGGKVDSEYQKKVSSAYPGRFGNYSIGIYNGGGFYSFEANNNKIFQGRLTLRPLGDILPGLQLSYSYLNGKGNTIEAPDYNYNHLLLSWESPRLVFTGQIYGGTGNFTGAWIDEEGDPYKTNGYSIFSEFKFIPSKLALMARYDYLTLEGEDPLIHSSLVGGLCYRFAGLNKVLLNANLSKISEEIIRTYEVVVELKF